MTRQNIGNNRDRVSFSSYVDLQNYFTTKPTNEEIYFKIIDGVYIVNNVSNNLIYYSYVGTNPQQSNTMSFIKFQSSTMMWIRKQV